MPRQEKDVWLNLTHVPTGRINLKLLLKGDGTLTVNCVCARDLYAPDKWAPKQRDWGRVGENIREAWEKDGEGGIPEQTNLPLRHGQPVCARLLSDGYCIFGEKCQFDHPIEIKRKARPPRKEKRLTIIQGLWGFLRENRTIDVTEMLKDIVIEQQGIQLELPKKMKHMLWRKSLSDLDGNKAENGSGSEEEEQSEEEGEDGEDGEEEEEGEEEDPDAPKITMFEKVKDKLTCQREPRYGLKIWYQVTTARRSRRGAPGVALPARPLRAAVLLSALLCGRLADPTGLPVQIRGDQVKLQSWWHDEWVYIESYDENTKRMRKKRVKQCFCCLLLLFFILLGFWLYFMMAGMSCAAAEYDECFDENDVHMQPCVMEFSFPTYNIKHINITTNRGVINVKSSSDSPNITVSISQVRERPAIQPPIGSTMQQQCE